MGITATKINKKRIYIYKNKIKENEREGKNKKSKGALGGACGEKGRKKWRFRT